MSSTLESIKDGGVFVVQSRRYGSLPRMIAVASSLHGAAIAVMRDGDFWTADGPEGESVSEYDVSVWQARGMWDDENKVFPELSFGKGQGHMSWHWNGQETDYVVQWSDIHMDDD